MYLLCLSPVLEINLVLSHSSLSLSPGFSPQYYWRIPFLASEIGTTAHKLRPKSYWSHLQSFQSFHLTVMISFLLLTSFHIGWYTTYCKASLPSSSLSSIFTYLLHTMCFPCIFHLFFCFIQCMDYTHCPCLYLMFFTFSVYKWVVYCLVTVEYSWESTDSLIRNSTWFNQYLSSFWNATRLLTVKNYYLIPWSPNTDIFLCLVQNLTVQ